MRKTARHTLFLEVRSVFWDAGGCVSPWQPSIFVEVQPCCLFCRCTVQCRAAILNQQDPMGRNGEALATDTG